MEGEVERDLEASELDATRNRNALKSRMNDRGVGSRRTEGGAVPVRLAAECNRKGFAAAERVVRGRSDWVESVESYFVPRRQRAQQLDVMRYLRAWNEKGRTAAKAITRFGCTLRTFRGSGKQCAIRQCQAFATSSTNHRE